MCQIQLTIELPPRSGFLRTSQVATVEMLNEFLLKKVSMKMPSFPILSWSASSKSSLATKSSSYTNSKKYADILQ